MKLRRCINLSILFFVLFSSCVQKIPPVPPVAKQIPKADTLFNDVRVDNYFWLRDKSNPEVIRYLEAENAYTEAVMQHTKKLQEKLYREMKGRIKESDMSVPEKIDDYYYYTRTEEGKQYRIHCRKKGSLEAPEELLLDENTLATGHEYFRIGNFEPSPDHTLLAYSTDTTGAETYTLCVKNLQTGQLLPEQISNTYYSLAWANDNRTFFYSVLDSTMRPYRLYRHTLGNDPQKDELVYEEKDLAYYLSVSKTKSRAFILMNLGSQVTSEVHYLKADDPHGQFKIVHPRQHGMEYSVEHHGDQFYIVTNDEAKNFKVVAAPTANPAKANWREVIPHRKEVKIDDIDVFRNHLVIYQRENGFKGIRVINFATKEDHQVSFPKPVYNYFRSANPDFNTDLLRFTYTSLTTPQSVYDYNMNSKERELKKQDEVVGGYDPSQYQSERLFAKAGDGTLVPISLAYKKDMKKDSLNHLFLSAYGAYGSSSDPAFSSNRLSLLGRGFITAIAHVRGGGEMGRYWYEDGKLLHKKNTFTDFIACAEQLIARKYTSTNHLVISGGSAGGLLMGAVTTMRPDLFNVVLAHVPFVDVLNTMLDPSLPLTVIEYEEWGNPRVEEYYRYMKGYSPYDNIQSKAYPNMLVTAGLNDPRVSYWEPAKWTAKLRAMKTDHHRLLLKTKMGAGHGGASGRYDYLKDMAFEYAFVMECLGIKQ